MPGASEAAGSAFVDTNIWVYAHLAVPGDTRHAIALKLVESKGERVISPQVVAEYYSVMLRNSRSDAWITANLRAMFARSARADSTTAALAGCNRVRANMARRLAAIQASVRLLRSMTL